MPIAPDEQKQGGTPGFAEGRRQIVNETFFDYS
jgi:hypothetical protein